VVDLSRLSAMSENIGATSSFSPKRSSEAQQQQGASTDAL
jgi:hypothetical protein